MKKLSLVLLVLLVVSAMFAQGTKESSDYKVYLITMDQMDQHWVNVDKGAQKAASELGGIQYKWLAPDVKDDAKQIECINNAVAGGADAILLAANGPNAVTAALKEAAGAGVDYHICRRLQQISLLFRHLQPIILPREPLLEKKC